MAVAVVEHYVRAEIVDLIAGTYGLGPTYRIGDYALYVRIMEGGACFVAGLEVEHLAGIPQEGSTCAEYVAVLIPSAEYKLGGLGNEEGLCIKLLFFDKEAGGDTLCNGVGGEQVPHNLALITSPGQVAGRAENCTEGLGMVRRMERDKAHFAQQNTTLNAGDQGVVYLTVSHVAPPDEHVGVVQYLVRQTLIGIVQSGESYLDVIFLGEEFSDGGVDAVGIQLHSAGVSLFVTEFVPDSNSDIVSHCIFLH